MGKSRQSTAERKGGDVAARVEGPPVADEPAAPDIAYYIGAVDFEAEQDAYIRRRGWRDFFRRFSRR